MAKNLTQWFPQSGIGYVLPQPGIYIQDNIGNNLVDNFLNFFVPTPYYVQGKYTTSWSQI